MTALEQIREFLLTGTPRAYCDDCLSTLLKIKPRQAVQQKTSKLGKIYPFHRYFGHCSHCKANKLVVGSRSADAANQGGESPPTLETVQRNSLNTADNSIFSEDEVKKTLEAWLTAQGWTVEIAWAKTRGIDIHAQKDTQRWIIEVKGGGSLQPMRVNYFLGVLGETLQRMDDASALYSIALPDLTQFRNLWSRLPALAKQRTQISALFVARNGSVEKVN